MDKEYKTYSPCKTIVSSIRTFLFKALDRGAERKRFTGTTSGAGGVGFIFKAEDLLPTKVTDIHLSHNLTLTKANLCAKLSFNYYLHQGKN